MDQSIISEPIEFEWDSGNFDKNIEKHGIKNEESESVFFDNESIIIDDAKHSILEPRYQIYGESNNDRFITVIFTIRKNKVRIISARKMNTKERSSYKYEKDK